MDVRSKKPEPFAHSEDQEDELLSIVPFKGLGAPPPHPFNTILSVSAGAQKLPLAPSWA
jgi:hypothetical protein